MNNIEQFRDAMCAAGLEPPAVIEPGKLHRFPGIGKRNGNTAGWCKLFDDGLGGCFGDWSTGLKKTWQAQRDKPMTMAERDAWRKQLKEAKREADAEQARVHAEAAKLAKSIYDAADKNVAGHPYAMKKRIDLGLLVRRGEWPQRGWKDALIVPLYDANGKLVTLEAINTDGDKDFLKGGAKKGAFHPIGEIRDAKVICIGEGLATVAVAGRPAVAAMDAGNLLAAAESVRQINPTAEIVFLADNDVRDDGRNPGVEAATAAARAIGGKIAIPEMGGRKCDFWDLWNERGAEAVANAIAHARTPAQRAESAPDGQYARGVRLIRASEVIPEPMAWLWNGWLARGKLHILAGKPGTGKTTLALAFAAIATTGCAWPDGSRCKTPGDVVIWSGEDDTADTIVPRLMAAGADLKRVCFVGEVAGLDGEPRPFDPAFDVPLLVRELERIRPALLIVDPIVSAVAADSHKNTEVRRALQPMVDMAARVGCAVLGISHLTKGTQGRDPTERVTGSIAFAALARVVLLAARHENPKENDPARLLVRSKSNLGPDEGGVGFDLERVEAAPGVWTPRIRWSGLVEGNARTLLARAEVVQDENDTELDDAQRFLRDLLADGPMPTKAIQAEARGAGYSWATIRRAKEALGVESRRTGGLGKSGSWEWALPKVLKEPLRCSHSESEHLRQEMSILGGEEDEEVVL